MPQPGRRLPDEPGVMRNPPTTRVLPSAALADALRQSLRDLRDQDARLAELTAASGVTPAELAAACRRLDDASSGAPGCRQRSATEVARCPR